MNKILTIILLFITMISCSDNNITISKEEYRKLKGDTVKSEYPKPFYFEGKDSGGGFNWRIELGEDNHEYLRNSGGNAFVLIHYPNCKKCIKKDTL